MRSGVCYHLPYLGSNEFRVLCPSRVHDLAHELEQRGRNAIQQPLATLFHPHEDLAAVFLLMRARH
jgi:hypothetical protein